MTAVPKLRLSRQTKDIELLLPFYRDGLGFEVLDRHCSFLLSFPDKLIDRRLPVPGIMSPPASGPRPRPWRSGLR